MQVTIYTPGWREAIMVKVLSQGHKCHDRDLNPHSNDFNQENLNLMPLKAVDTIGNFLLKIIITF